MNQLKSLQFHTASAKETEALGEAIGELLVPGTVVALYGNLGAGKTTITRGMARGLKIEDMIHSPTFNLLHEHKGLIPLYHFDVYRLTDSSDMEDLGYEEYFYSSGVTIIEWSEIIADILPPDHLEIHLNADSDMRTIIITSTGNKTDLILRGLNNLQ
jgi:tRNA threonylcarbamoyladenosine biosynthesis protein TsaE